MVSYQYLKCAKCGRITRVLTYSSYWSTCYCNHCGEPILQQDAVTKDAYLKQHTIAHRDPGESPGVPHEKTGVPLSKNTPRKVPVETTFWYAVED